MLGNLKYSLANSSLGAIITHCVLSDDGEHLAAAESGKDNTKHNLNDNDKAILQESSCSGA